MVCPSIASYGMSGQVSALGYIPSGVQLTMTLYSFIISGVTSSYVIVFSFFVRLTNSVSRPSVFRPYSMAFDAPPVPNIRAFLCAGSSIGSILLVKPITSLLNPFSTTSLPLWLTLMTFTAPMAFASGLSSSRYAITFCL